MFFLLPDSCLNWSRLKWNRLLPAIPCLCCYCYQSEMEKSTHTHTQAHTHTHTHTHTHNDEDEGKIGEKGMEGEMRAWGWQSRDFSATGMINISLFFILLEWLRNNFLLALTQAGIKSSFSPLLSHSGFIFTLPTEVTVVIPLPLVTVIISCYYYNSVPQ